MRRWWRGLDPWNKGFYVFLVTTTAVSVAFVLAVLVSNVPNWFGVLPLPVGLLVGFLAGALANVTATRNRRAVSQATTATVTARRHNARDRNCVRWQGDPRTPTDLTQRCLHCNPKSVVQVISPYDDDDDDEDWEDCEATQSMLDDLRQIQVELERRARNR